MHAFVDNLGLRLALDCELSVEDNELRDVMLESILFVRCVRAVAR